MEDPLPGEEAAEVKASRAEGNEPMDIHQVIQRQAASYNPDTFGIDTESRGPRDDDDEKNAEQKRQAAAEEHAQKPSRRPPHGNL